MKIAIVHGNDGSDVRIGKVCRSLSKMGFDIHFIGWERTPQIEKRIDLGQAKRSVLEFPTLFGRNTIAGHFRFGCYAVKMLRRLRPEVCVAVNEDHAALVLPFKGLYYKHLVIDVFDALADRYNGKSHFLASILWAIQSATRNRADRLIATDERRFRKYGRCRQKTFIIENYPEDPGEAMWSQFPEGPTKIYVAGTLTESNALRQVIEVAHRQPELRILSAGWLRDDYAKNVFSKDTQVDFRGIVTLKESLELAAQCDAVLAHYKPSSTNSRLASPNKVYDAMSVGRSVIVNSETGLGEWVREHSLGYDCPYGDIDALQEIVQSLPKAREKLFETGRIKRRLFVDNYTWRHMERRLKEMYHGLDTES